MTRPRPALLVLGAGALALAAATVGIASAGSGQHVPSVGARPDTSVSASLEPETPAGLSSTAGSTQPVTSPYRSLARQDATRLPRPDRTPRPVDITIPVLDIDAPVDVVGLDARNQVDVPVDVQRAGWYRFSARPSAGAGSTVIVGHIDGVTQGAGVFYRLGELRLDDEIVLTTADGTRLTYVVVAREAFDKKKVPLAELFSRSGPERLTLITCGGPFDPATLEYTDNIVVTAIPSADQAGGVDKSARVPETRR
jgi:LPXTG-site transpeptidase (sortase) family protein